MSKNIVGDVVKKALTDPSFKAELLKNPAAAVEKATGVKVPAGVTLKVVEDSASTVHLVLPAASGKGQIPDQDLGKVAGGGPGGFFITARGYCDLSSNSYPCG